MATDPDPPGTADAARSADAPAQLVRKIIVAIDLGEHSARALERACRLAADTAASLCAVHVPAAAATESDQAALRLRIRKQVLEVFRQVADRAVDFSVIVAEGVPDEVVPLQTERIGADLVILGGHGEPRFRDTIFGITAAHVLQRCAAPVLVAQGEAGGDYGRVMAAVEDDGSAPGIIRLAARIAPDAEIIAVHAIDRGPLRLFQDKEAIGVLPSDRERALLQSLSEALGPDAPSRLSVLIEEGDPMEVIQHSSERLRPDLIAMGTHGRMGMERLIHGSLAEYVLLWAPSDVLVLPAC